MVVFVEQDDADGLYRRWVRLSNAGDLLIEGQDLGATVERLWGAREYEFARTVAAVHVPALRTALGIADATDLLGALRTRFESTHALEQYVEAAGIPSTFWSRVGD